MSNNGLDYKLIAEQCGLNSNNDIDFVISNIDKEKPKLTLEWINSLINGISFIVLYESDIINQI